MELRIEDPGLGKVLADGSMNPSMLPESEILLMQDDLGGIEHRLVSAARCEIDIPFFQQPLRGTNRPLGLVKEPRRGFLHSAMASSRTFRRKGVSRSCQSRSLTKTLLTLTPYFRERSALSCPARLTSLP